MNILDRHRGMRSAARFAWLVVLAGCGGALAPTATPPTTASAQAPARETPQPCVCSCPPHGEALSQTTWARRFGDRATQVGSSVTTDRAGNVLLTGGFAGEMSFGETTLRAHGRRDLFLAKFDAEGRPVWSLSFGVERGSGYCGARSVATDREGNIVLAGDFQGTVSFGGSPLESGDGYDVFVAKFDAQGRHVWSRRFGGADRDLASGLSLDHVGNVFLTGEFRNKVDFGGGPLISAGDVDIFVVKLDQNGEHLYSKGFGGPREDFGTGIAADFAGNVVVTGEYTDSVAFGDQRLRTAMGYDIFVVKLDQHGETVWSKSFGPLDSSGIHGGRSIALDRSGNVLLTGDFRDRVEFGGDMLVSAGAYDVFVAKLDPEGRHLWSKRFGDTEWDTAESIATDGVGNVIIGGGYQGTVDFGGGPLPSAGRLDGFVLALDPWGNYRGARAFGDKASQSAMSVTVDYVGHVFVAGTFEGSLDFGRGPLASAGAEDVFFAKLGH